MFSLLCTVYNRENYLAQAIQSVLEQSFKSWELVIWDDGSTDDSLAIAKRFAARDGRIYAGGTSANTGRALALRNAIYAAQGEWIGLLDSDDYLHPDSLEVAAQSAVIPGCGLIYTDRHLIDTKGNLLRSQTSPSPEEIRKHDIYGQIPFHLQLYRRSHFDQTDGVDITLKGAIDYDLSLKMLEVPGMGLTHIQKPLYYHRIHPDRISADQDAQTVQALKATRKAIKRRKLDLQANLMWKIQPTHTARRAPSQ